MKIIATIIPIRPVKIDMNLDILDNKLILTANE